MAEEDKRDEHEKKFHMVFYRMSEMVERMYGDYEKRMKKKEKKKEAPPDDYASVNQGAGGDPPEPLSSPSSSSSSSSENSRHSQHSNHKASFKIRQVEVYFQVQHIDKEEVKVQLASLRLEGTALVWWESKLHDRSKYGKLLSSWSDFKTEIRKQFYPLGYLHKVMMEWKTLR
jgi:hypothetical protein